MKKETRIKDWQRMYDESTKPELLEEARRKHEIKKMADDKKKDTGVC